MVLLHNYRAEKDLRLSKWILVLLSCLSSIPRARAEATLFLGEPYGYDGALAGTGHAAVYLSGVCAASPVVLRLCQPGESGVVISRYHGVAGHDWLAIPLIPYLYAVEKREDIPLFADRKLVEFLRNHYRRNHLESIAADDPGGASPDGNWYELVGASYLRTIYAYSIETSPELDAALISKLNAQPNRERYRLVTANCADFARALIDFYHPHAVHRSIVGDLGVTTPKQAAKTLAKYSRRHPEFESSHFVIPQVPGTVSRSRPVHGVLECAITAKKYMLPLLALHPYVAGSLIAAYVGHWRYNPAQNALVLDALNQLDVPPSRQDRRVFQDRFEELVRGGRVEDPLPANSAEERRWSSRLAATRPSLDGNGEPALEVREASKLTSVGIARTNILGSADAYEFATSLVEARLREELKVAPARKAARADVENDLALLRQLLEQQSIALGLAKGAGSVTVGTLRAEGSRTTSAPTPVGLP